MSETAFLTAEGITRRYGANASSHLALRGICLSVQRGEFVAIQGPSGCGKSTLLHILGAMDRPTSGEIRLNDRRLDLLDLNALAAVRRKQIGFVFQAFNLLPTLNVLENTSLPLMLDGVSDQEARQRAADALTAVGLESKECRFPSELSGGEMQRAAIARALVIEPDLVIADEPTGSLDSTNGLRVLELLAELNQARQITVLMATHSDEAAAFAGRVLNVKDGQLQQEV